MGLLPIVHARCQQASGGRKLKMLDSFASRRYQRTRTAGGTPSTPPIPASEPANKGALYSAKYPEWVNACKRVVTAA